MNVALIRKENILREIYYKEESEIKEYIKEDIFRINKYNIDKYYVKSKFVIGDNADIKMKNQEIFIDMKKKEIISNNKIFYNFTETTGKVKFEYGDNIIVGLSIKIEFISENIIQVINYFSNTRIDLLKISNLDAHYKDYPHYYSSPIYIKDQEEKEIKLELPPEKEKKNKLGDTLKKLIPLGISIIIAILMLKIRPRGIRGLLMLTSTLVSASITVITLIQDKKEAKAYNEHRKKVYKNYLGEKREELNLSREKELKIYNDNNLASKSIINEIKMNSSRLFERELSGENFLEIRIGLSTEEPCYKIKNPNDKLKLKKEDMELELEEVYEDYKTIDNVPYIINLKRNNIGLIGDSDVIDRHLHNIIIQLIFSHSYHDLKVVNVLTEEDYDKISYTKWIKHFTNESTGLNNFVINESTRDQILNSYIQILRHRDEESDKDTLHKPHLLFIITNYELIKNHPIMEYLLKDHNKLGFSILLITKDAKSLPKIIETVVEYKNSGEATILLENNKSKEKEIKLEDFIEDKDVLEESVRKLGQLEHIQGVRSSIPEKLTFLDMFNVETVEELEIKKRWDQNRSYDSLSVVVGKKTENDYVELNLHEKAHGPHGLVAGTTGSGKSEVIQTYILSLALNYSPEEVGFLLIDYKGGGMANLFKNMPHHLGSITNLDGYQSMRALASIKSELKRRQQIFSDNEVNHINGYHKLYEKNEVKEALPHLFLISDEFAELKAEQPDFMKELVSAARIGRSLGIHLILATQKPAGVVDEQIWSNSKFKLSLKVAEEADSREILKTVDAAYITQPGRGYLKVGNNELYELFQSGYSGAGYSQAAGSKLDKRIFEINESGNMKLLNSEVLEEEVVEEEEDERTELDAVLEEISKEYEEAGYQKVKRPWLAPLKERIVSKQNIMNLKENISNLNVVYGIVDLPNSQAQIDLEHNLALDGHLAIFGTTGMGKSITLMTIATQLAQQNSPELLKYFVFDFGNSSLIHLKALKHTGEYLKVEDGDKIKKVLKLLEKEIAIRKKLFESMMVNNFDSYNKVADKKIEAIVLILDNFDALKDMDKSYIDYLISLTREGASLGIFMIMTALKSNSIKSSILNVINNRVILFTNDKSDISTLIGRSAYPQQEIPGRVHVKIDEIEVGQIYYPIEHESEEEYITNMKEYIGNINNSANDIQNIGLEEMPENYEFEITKATVDKIYLGKEYSETQDYYIELPQALLIQGEMKSGKTNVIRLLTEQLKDNYKIAIFDDMMKNLYSYSIDEKVTYIEEIQDTMYRNEIFIINKLDFITSLDKKLQKEIFDLLYKEFLKGKYFIIESFDGLKGSFELIKTFKRPMGVIWIDDINAQKFGRVKDKDMKQEEKDKFDFYYIQGKDIIRIKPPHININNEVKYEIVEEVQLEVGGSILENESMLIAGKNSDKVLEKLKEGYDSIDIKYEEIDYDKLSTYKEIDESVVLILKNLEQLNEQGRDQRIESLDILLEVSKKNTMITHMDVEKVKGAHDFIKALKRPERAIISDDLGEQKYKRVKNRDYKTKEVSSNEAYFIYEKTVKKIEL